MTSGFEQGTNHLYIFSSIILQDTSFQVHEGSAHVAWSHLEQSEAILGSNIKIRLTHKIYCPFTATTPSAAQ